MIVCFQETHRISRHYGADFDDVVDMLEDIHRLRLNKPLHYPGVIGGHCLIPNTELLLSVYDSEFLRLILESNEKRKEEITDESTRSEVKKIEKRWKLWRRVGSAKSLIFLSLTPRLAFMSETCGSALLFLGKNLMRMENF